MKKKPEPITTEQVEKYINRSNVCPYCGSNDLDWSETKYDAVDQHQDVECGSCHKRWRELQEVKVVDIEPLEYEDGDCGECTVEENGKTVSVCSGCQKPAETVKREKIVRPSPMNGLIGVARGTAFDDQKYEGARVSCFNPLNDMKGNPSISETLDRYKNACKETAEGCITINGMTINSDPPYMPVGRALKKDALSELELEQVGKYTGARVESFGFTNVRCPSCDAAVRDALAVKHNFKGTKQDFDKYKITGKETCSCGRVKKAFVHTCPNSKVLTEKFGCPYCDDECGECDAESENGGECDNESPSEISSVNACPKLDGNVVIKKLKK